MLRFTATSSSDTPDPFFIMNVHIHYRRLPDREQVFQQIVLEQTPSCVVTFLESAPVPEPVRVNGRTVLEPGSPVVWFTYPNRWYDIGRFHLADGTLTGTYANILTPVRMRGTRWDTTDLCLDVWRGADGEVRILDGDEFAEAVSQGWIDEATARNARTQAEALWAAARAGTWPPPAVAAWTLERALAQLQADDE